MRSQATQVAKNRLASLSTVSSLVAALAIVSLSTIIVWISRQPDHAPRDRIAAAYERGIDFLAATQRPEGDFPTYHWPTGNMTKAVPVNAVFTTSQVLYSLAFDVEGSSRPMSDLAIGYLRSQEEAPGVWRYYGKAAAQLLSPDVDDTSVAWAALMLHGYSPTPAALAQITGARTDTGLLNTWIGDPATWTGIDSREIDIVVNLNGLLLFALAGRPLDDVCRHAVERARSGAFLKGSTYYGSPLAFTYALSRAYADGGAGCLTGAMPAVRASVLDSQQPDGGWGDDLETALGVLTLWNIGDRGEAGTRGIKAILSRQSPDGGWALAPAYRAAVLPVSYGSRSITTALCLEALAKHLKH